MREPNQGYDPPENLDGSNPDPLSRDERTNEKNNLLTPCPSFC